MNTDLIEKRDLDWHAAYIRQAQGICVESIIEYGRRIANALDDLPYGEKESLWAAIKLSKVSGYKLIAISESEQLVTHVLQLPPSWGTLHQFSRLDIESWKAAEEQGLIHPQVKRNEVEDFIRERGGMKTMEKKPKRKVNLASEPKGLEKVNYKSTLNCLDPVMGKEFGSLKEFRAAFIGEESNSDFPVNVQRAIGFAAGHPAFTVIDNGSIRIDHNPEIQTIEEKNEELESKLKLTRIHDTEDVELSFYLDHLIQEFDAWEQTYGKGFRGIDIDEKTRKEIKESCAALERKAADFVTYVKEIADV